MSWRWLAAAAVTAALLLALAIQLPASVVPKVLSSRLPALSLTGVSGSLWRGQALEAGWNQWSAGPLSWRLDAPPLLLLKTRLHLELSGPPLRGQVSLQRRFDGSVSLSDVRLTLPAVWLQQIINQPALGLAGEVELIIERARLDSQGWLVALDGSASWRNAAVRTIVAPGQASSPGDRQVNSRISALGDLSVSWHTVSDGQIQGTLADGGGPLGLTGQVTIANRSYRVRAQLSARSGEVALRQALAYLGRPQPSGDVRLEIFGPLVPLGGKRGP